MTSRAREIRFFSRFQDRLPGDRDLKNQPRQVEGACYSFVKPKVFAAPRLVALAEDLAADLALDMAFCQSPAFSEIFVGNLQAPGMRPYACCYGGHQFGNWAGQLGDGRAINLGERPDSRNQSLTYQLKGAGPTPYSRFADGLAVLRSSIREFLCSEAMHHLGIPTTRALSLIRTGEEVERDMFYDGNPQMEPGAVVSRIAPSFTRFGSFEIFTARGDLATLEALVAYTIEYDFPHLFSEYQKDRRSAMIRWLAEVAERTCELIIHWMRVGFVHGVMNTDNMSILGLTIDYGPYGWLDDYNPSWTPNTTDAQHRRYRYQNQPAVAQWNLLQLANAIYPLIKSTTELENIVSGFGSRYEKQWRAMMAAKLGLQHTPDEKFLEKLTELLAKTQMDMTLFFHALEQHNAAVDITDTLSRCTYKNTLSDMDIEAWRDWYIQYDRVRERDSQTRQQIMRSTNPVFVLRNYLTQTAIEQAYQGDDTMVLELLTALKHPYADHPSHHAFRDKRPAWAEKKPGCSMLSCSS